MERVCIYDPKKKRRIEIVDVFVLLAVLAFSIFILIKYNIFQSEISKEVARYGLIGIFGMAFLFDMIPQLFHPFMAVVLASGIGFNLFYATFFAILGSTLGSIVGFEIGRKYGFGFVCPLFSKNSMKKIIHLWDRHGDVFVFISALTPVPYVPLIFGALGLRKKAFLFYGIVPRVVSLVFLGILLHFGINFF